MSGAVTAQETEASGHVYALPPGTKLKVFIIERVLGHGGFGITYLAKDMKNKKQVAIKEYLPGELAVRVSNSTVKARSSEDQKHFDDGVFSFLEEAKRIARVVHPNIMEVQDFFTMNGTAYIVLRYELGKTLKERLDSPISEKSMRAILDGILQGLAAIHDHDKALLHRDVKPANIILSRNRSKDQEIPVLIDFGAAREFANRNSRSVTALVSPGYSPPEQYGAGDQQGPWTDLYALGATAYRCVTGDAPPDSLSRLGNDRIVPATVKAKGKYSDDLLRLIDWMMMIKEADRPRSAHVALEALRASASPSETTGGDSLSAPGDLAVSGDGRDHFILQFDRPIESKALGLSFKVTPPNRFLGPLAAGGFQQQPHFFNLVQMENEDGEIGFRGGPAIRRQLRRGAQVAVASQDGTIAAKTTWPLVSNAPPPAVPGNKAMAIVALGLAAFGALALNIGYIQDTVCEQTGLCTAQQVLFRTANECVARASSCGAEACVADFGNRATLPRLIERMSAITTKAAAACRGDDEANYERAKACADEALAGGGGNAGACKAVTCYAPYLSSFPNGANVQAARAATARARSTCNVATSTPAPTATPAPAATSTPRPSPSAPPRPTVALPDGTYSAVRTFIEPKSISDPLSCPPSTNIQVTVKGNVITFENYEGNTGITRKWKGEVRADGLIGFQGSQATPPTPNEFTILGNYASATVNSRFCGKGYFKITKP